MPLLFVCSRLHAIFCNVLRRRWPKPSLDAGDADHLTPSDCALIKTHLLQLLLTAPPRIQAQLSEALAAAAASDFPSKWESLLPSIVSSLGTAISKGDVPTTNSLLSAAASLFSRFRNAFDNNAIRLDLKYCLDNFAAPLLEVFLSTSRRLQAAATTTSPPESRPVFECLRLYCEIFYSLNSIDLAPLWLRLANLAPPLAPAPSPRLYCRPGVLHRRHEPLAPTPLCLPPRRPPQFAPSRFVARRRAPRKAGGCGDGCGRS
ncbi:hypothetical protein GUJ93_ZPchr0015g6754 [Zizania palustris]|uniref:Exportin-2 central domain-containing protein n=1 Tax=Zizania palustris TaxID=103762 RepID=A0A8J5VVI2_ZIZPA|nr:hypothetical protein GUJ93_ZPchr0015g6754 [Zizania palustris]